MFYTDQLERALTNKKTRKYVSVLFVTEDGKRALLMPEGDKWTLASRMGTEDTHSVPYLLCDIFNIDPTKVQAAAACFETVDGDGVPATYHYRWMVAKHPEDQFLRSCQWRVLEEVGSDELTSLAQAAIAMARAEGVLFEPQIAEAV